MKQLYTDKKVRIKKNTPLKMKKIDTLLFFFLQIFYLFIYLFFICSGFCHTLKWHSSLMHIFFIRRVNACLSFVIKREKAHLIQREGILFLSGNMKQIYSLYILYHYRDSHRIMPSCRRNSFGSLILILPLYFSALSHNKDTIHIYYICALTFLLRLTTTLYCWTDLYFVPTLQMR